MTRPSFSAPFAMRYDARCAVVFPVPTKNTPYPFASVAPIHGQQPSRVVFLTFAQNRFSRDGLTSHFRFFLATCFRHPLPSGISGPLVLDVSGYCQDLDRIDWITEYETPRLLAITEFALGEARIAFTASSVNRHRL